MLLETLELKDARAKEIIRKAIYGINIKYLQIC